MLEKRRGKGRRRAGQSGSKAATLEESFITELQTISIQSLTFTVPDRTLDLASPYPPISTTNTQPSIEFESQDI